MMRGLEEPMRHLSCLVPLIVLAACGPTVAERTQDLQRFVGQPESAVAQQFGVPARVYETGGIRFLAYTERRLGYAPGLYGAAPYGPYGWYGWGYAAFPPPQVERVCETTFEIQAGTVRNVALRGACGN